MYKRSCILVGMLCISSFIVGQTTSLPVGHWPSNSQTHKPWTRWWWMGSAVDSTNLAIAMQQYQQAGFGGLEITPIYGAKGYESRYLSYLSPAWMTALTTTTQLANRYGLGIDLNLGTGWPFGGPQISQENASSRQFIQTYPLKEGEVLQEKILPKLAEQRSAGSRVLVLTAYSDKGEVRLITSYLQADGQLNWTAPQGRWTIYALFLGKTLQKVKRAAPGGEGWVMDHFSEKALSQYLRRFDTTWHSTIPKVRAFFNDSYEVYDADFTPDFLSEFNRQHGYDLSYHLRELATESDDNQVLRIKADYRATLGTLLQKSFLQPWQTWTHVKGKLLRNQAHGSPANILDLYALSDIPECETFGSTYFPIKGLRRDTADIRKVHPEPLMMRFAPSAAHVMGKKLVSAETFTWLTEHFRTSLSQCKPEVEQLFLAGVNHLFFHGTTYSPSDVTWPGWMFYAGVNFSPNNSFWPHVNGLTDYITRCQSILQQGTSDNELLVYWPMQDIWHQQGELIRQIRVHEVNTWLYPESFYKVSSQLKQAGYAFDFISDQQLLHTTYVGNRLSAAKGGGQYKAIIIPKTTYIPLETLQRLRALAAQGATLIFEELPESVEGWHEWALREQRLKTINQQLIQYPNVVKHTAVITSLKQKGILPERLVTTGLQFVRRKMDKQGYYYYLVNATNHTIDTLIEVHHKAKSVFMLDPQSGKTGLVSSAIKGDYTELRVQLQSGESLFLETSPQQIAGMPWNYRTMGTPQQIDGLCELRFKEGGPVLPPSQTLPALGLWTATTDSLTQQFSGTGVYTLTFDLQKTAKDYLLDLGSVAESARVFVNDQDAGLAWAMPMQVAIGKYLVTGRNTLRIEVCNLMANRIRFMDKSKQRWRNYHEINFVNAHYKPFDASNWSVMDSGLRGPLTLIPLQ